MMVYLFGNFVDLHFATEYRSPQGVDFERGVE